MGIRRLEMRDIVKTFPGVQAVDHVDLTLDEGEVLALVGENGAGKSTLIKILSGAYKLDGGSIEIEGRRVDPERYIPQDSIEMGVSVIYQELNYLKTVSVAENIFLGRLPKTKRGFVDYKRLYADSRAIQRELGLDDIDPSTDAGGLLTAQKQLLEVARAFVRNSRIIVMDEPTASLTDREIDQLYAIIRKFRAAGGSVIFISHKLDEVFAVCDAVMVMRDGKRVLHAPIGAVTKDGIIQAMVGRELSNMYPVSERTLGGPVFKIAGLTTAFLKDVHVTVRAGEIVGLYGLMGAGCEEVTRCAYGVEHGSATIEVEGRAVRLSGPSDAIRAGIAYVPGERKEDGLLLNMPVKANITISNLKAIQSGRMLDLRREAELSAQWVRRMDVKTPDVDTDVESLSGGNQQKVVFAKCLNVAPKVLLLNEPTRGVDVGAKAEIYKLLEQFCEAGLGILMASSEMPETIAICDRIIVMHSGRVTAEFSKRDAPFDQLAIMKAVLGE